VAVPLEKLTKDDQAFLREHFGVGEATDGGDEGMDVPEGKEADDLPHPLGASSEEISCGDDYGYFLYLPKSLRAGAKHPVLFLMGPGGGSKGTAKRYITGAERNRWIIATSKQSKNGFDGSKDAIDSMVKHVTSTLPIDEKRMYTTGFSGGSRMAFVTAQAHGDIAGVLACGAGATWGARSRWSMACAAAIASIARTWRTRSRDSKAGNACLRYFPAKHSWGGDELCDDGITHLNGVFSSTTRTTIPPTTRIT
jgi:pimeloyl-ACP methyl ester carboxylesterase